MAEKQVALVDSREVSDDEDFTWTEKEEKALVRRLDLLVMPLLMMGFFVLQLDRGNIGNAMTDFFLRDVGITQNQFNVGQQLLSLGIVLLEIPSNLILYRTGPTIWIGCQIIAWGFVATFQTFQKGLASFLITRLLLGFCESGFIPAGLFTITRWYKRDETSKRFSWFFIGNMGSGACSGLIAYGILHMRGIAGLAGWQWLFLIEGILTILAGLIFLTLFPFSPSNPVSLFHHRYFTARESKILHLRILADDPTKSQPRRHVSLSELLQALSNWRLLPHILLTIAGLAPSALMMSYAPSLVVSFGFDRLQANAMTSIGAWILLVTNVAWGMISDRWGKRGGMVALGLVLYWGTALGNRLLIDSTNANLRFAFITLGIVFSSNWHPVNGSWMALNANTSGERSITMAVLIMSANTAGIVGSQIFQQEDGPKYRKGWTVILALASFALLMSFVANIQYWVLNRRGKTKKDGSKFNL